jgi:transposase
VPLSAGEAKEEKIDLRIHKAQVRYGNTLKEFAQRLGVGYTTSIPAVERMETQACHRATCRSVFPPGESNPDDGPRFSNIDK